MCKLGYYVRKKCIICYDIKCVCCFFGIDCDRCLFGIYKFVYNCFMSWCVLCEVGRFMDKD